MLNSAMRAARSNKITPLKKAQPWQQTSGASLSQKKQNQRTYDLINAKAVDSQQAEVTLQRLQLQQIGE